VCDGGREFTYRGQARHTREIRVCFAQRFIGPPALGHVHHRPDKPRFTRIVSFGMGHNVDIFNETVRHQ